MMKKFILRNIIISTLLASTPALAEKMEFCAVNKISGEIFACWDFLNTCETMKGETFICVPRTKSE